MHNNILAAVDAEITKLHQVRAVLLGLDTGEAVKPRKKLGRPPNKTRLLKTPKAGSKAAKAMKTALPSTEPAVVPRASKWTPERRKKLSAAMKKAHAMKTGTWKG